LVLRVVAKRKGLAGNYLGCMEGTSNIIRLLDRYLRNIDDARTCALVRRVQLSITRYYGQQLGSALAQAASC
jgi:hypothetical protein